VPGDSLYSLKRTVENIELSFADNQSRPDILYRDAQRRLAEVNVLTARRQPLTDDVLVDVTQSINAALAVQPDRDRIAQLLTQTENALEQAQTQGLLTPAVKAATLKNLPTLPVSVSATDIPTSASTAAMTATSTPTATFTLTPTATPTATDTSVEPIVEPTETDTSSGQAVATATDKPGPDKKPSHTPRPKPTQKPGNSGPPQTKPGNPDPGGNKGGNSDKGGGKP
jgi:hypothetical protein